jgi:hypothetical protein
MKKYICLIMVICLTASFAQAQDVTFSLSGSGALVIDYTSTTPPRGIALKCTVLGGDLVSIDTGAVTQDPCFNTNIDYAYTEYTGGGTYNIGDGHPIADPCGPGVLAPTTDIDQFSICLGVLDQSGNQKPGPSATTLVTVPLTSAASSVTILVEEDGLRGGVAGSQLSTNLPQQVVIPLGPTDCLVAGQVRNGVTINAAHIAAWNAQGKPSCWCNHCFQIGDNNDDCLGTTGDLFPVLNGLDPSLGYTPCMDINMDGLATTGDLFPVLNFLDPGLGISCHPNCVNGGGAVSTWP